MVVTRRKKKPLPRVKKVVAKKDGSFVIETAPVEAAPAEAAAPETYDYEPVRPRPNDRTINDRLTDQVALLLDDLEDRHKRDELSVRERISALLAIGRIQTVFKALARKPRDRKGEGEYDGSAVNSYTRAFADNAPRVREAGAGDDGRDFSVWDRRDAGEGFGRDGGGDDGGEELDAGDGDDYPDLDDTEDHADAE